MNIPLPLLSNLPVYSQISQVNSSYNVLVRIRGEIIIMVLLFRISLWQEHYTSDTIARAMFTLWW